MTEQAHADAIYVGGKIYTGDPEKPWAEALAVRGTTLLAVGSESEVRSRADAGASVHDLGGRFVMPGLVDVHAHLGLGGGQVAFELSILPTDSLAVILEKVRDWAGTLAEGEWIVGGIVGSTVMDDLSADDLAALDEASLGHPVLLRDDSMHNRWVNSVALQTIGVGANTPNPEGGTYVHDAEGRLTGVLWELAGNLAEEAVSAAVANPEERNLVALKSAVDTLNSFGITAVQDAATMKYALQGLHELDAQGKLTAHVVASMPSRTFIEPGVTGAELYEYAETQRSEHLRPDFSKYVLDGVPMTRTSAMIHPYICGHGDDPEFVGASLWTLEDLRASLLELAERGLHAKLHATGDASVRIVLDAVETVRERFGDGPIFHIAHPEYIDEADVARFARLGVVPDASPYLWFPSVIQESIAKQIPAATFERSWVLRDLLESGALVSGGSDWPCAALTPDPWTGLGAMVTRRNPDANVTGALNPDQAIGVSDAIAAFTSNPAKAMGLQDVTGTLREGLSADFIVLDRDIVAGDAGDIAATRVLETYFEGRLVYSAPQ